MPLYRLYLLRFVYALIGFAEGAQIWPGLFHHGNIPLSNGVVRSLLGALTLLCVAIGLRYPIKALPLLFFELAWKVIWLTSFALPLWIAHSIDPDTADTIFACSLVVIVPIALPWRYVFDQYVFARGDRWK